MHSCSYNLAWLWIPNEVESSFFLHFMAAQSSWNSRRFLVQIVFPFHACQWRGTQSTQATIVHRLYLNNMKKAALSFGLAEANFSFLVFTIIIISTWSDFDDLIFKGESFVMQKTIAKLKFTTQEMEIYFKNICGRSRFQRFLWNVNFIFIRITAWHNEKRFVIREKVICRL